MLSDSLSPSPQNSLMYEVGLRLGTTRVLDSLSGQITDKCVIYIIYVVCFRTVRRKIGSKISMKPSLLSIST